MTPAEQQEVIDEIAAVAGDVATLEECAEAAAEIVFNP